MKKINFFASLLAMTLCIGFTSCGDDEGNNGENAGTGNVFPEGTKRLATMSNNGETTTFTYDGNKLISVKRGNDTNITFDYSGDNVVMTSIYTYTSNNKIQEEKDIYTLKIDANGFATSGIEEFVDSDGTEKAYFTFKYDGDHLVAIETTGSFGYDNYKLTWTDGNITKVVNDYKEDSEPVETGTTLSSYATELNTAGLPFFELVGVDLDDLEYAYYAGLLGKSTKNLLKSTDEEALDPEKGEKCTYVYELNADKYPTKITQSYSYNGGSSYDSSTTLTYK